MSGTKICKKRNQYFKLQFFTINLHFVISNQKSTYRKLNLPLTSSIYFVSLTSRNAKKTRTDQSIPRVFLLCLKRNDPQTFKSGSCKNPFLQCVCYWYNLLRWMFLFYVITGRHYFSWKITLRCRETLKSSHHKNVFFSAVYCWDLFWQSIYKIFMSSDKW